MSSHKKKGGVSMLRMLGIYFVLTRMAKMIFAIYLYKKSN